MGQFAHYRVELEDNAAEELEWWRKHAGELAVGIGRLQRDLSATRERLRRAEKNLRRVQGSKRGCPRWMICQGRA